MIRALPPCFNDRRWAKGLTPTPRGWQSRVMKGISSLIMNQCWTCHPSDCSSFEKINNTLYCLKPVTVKSFVTAKNYTGESQLWSEYCQLCKDSKWGELVIFFKRWIVLCLIIRFAKGTRQSSSKLSFPWTLRGILPNLNFIFGNLGIFWGGIKPWKQRDFSQASRVTISWGHSVLSSGCHGLGSHILVLPAIHMGQGVCGETGRERAGWGEAWEVLREKSLHPPQAHSGALCPVPSASDFTYVRKLSWGRNISSLLLWEISFSLVSLCLNFLSLL